MSELIKRVSALEESVIQRVSALEESVSRHERVIQQAVDIATAFLRSSDREGQETDRQRKSDDMGQFRRPERAP